MRLVTGETDEGFELVFNLPTARGEPEAYLRAMADHIEQSVPTVFAKPLVDALRAAADVPPYAPPEERARVLAHGLGLAHDNRRSVVHPASINGTMHGALAQGLSETKAAAAVAKKFGIGISTVWSAWRPYREAVRKQHGFLPWADHRVDDDPADHTR